MYKTIFSHIGNYKKQAILAPVTIIGEVAMEVTIPLVMAHIIDDGIRQGKVSYVASDSRSLGFSERNRHP